MAITGAYDNYGAGPDALEKSVEWGGGHAEHGITGDKVAVAAGAAIGAILNQILADVAGLSRAGVARFGLYGALLGAGLTYAGQRYYQRGQAGIANTFLDDHWWERTYLGPKGMQYTLRPAGFLDLGGNAKTTKPGIINMQEGSGNGSFALGYNGAAMLGAADRLSGKRTVMARKIAAVMYPLIMPGHFSEYSGKAEGDTMVHKVLAPFYAGKIAEARGHVDKLWSKVSGSIMA